jgi:tetratricopeptide (TPR) repeat protein
MKQFFIMALVLGGGYVIECGKAFSADSDQGNTNQCRTIKTSDLMAKASDGYIKPTVIGELGYPLGKLVTIAGYWRRSDNSYEGLQFHVVSVNGVGVGGTGVVFAEGSIKQDGIVTREKTSCKEWDKWELRGYESGAFSGYNSEIFAEMNMMPVPGYWHQYRKEFIYFRLKNVDFLLPDELELLKDIERGVSNRRETEASEKVDLARFLNAAKRSRQKGSHRDALVILNAAVEKYPRSALAYASRGDYRFAVTDHEKAIADYTRAIELDPMCSVAYKGLGSVRLFDKDYEGAITYFTKAIELDPKDAAARYARGVTHFKANRLDQALEDVNRALREEETLGDAYRFRGLVLLNLGATRAALSDLNHAIEFGSTDANAYWIRSFVHEKLGEQEMSESDRKMAIELDPQYGIENVADAGMVIFGRKLGVPKP